MTLVVFQKIRIFFGVEFAGEGFWCHGIKMEYSSRRILPAAGSLAAGGAIVHRCPAPPPRPSKFFPLPRMGISLRAARSSWVTDCLIKKSPYWPLGVSMRMMSQKMAFLPFLRSTCLNRVLSRRERSIEAVIMVFRIVIFFSMPKVIAAFGAPLGRPRSSKSSFQGACA